MERNSQIGKHDYSPIGFILVATALLCLFTFIVLLGIF